MTTPLLQTISTMVLAMIAVASIAQPATSEAQVYSRFYHPYGYARYPQYEDDPTDYYHYYDYLDNSYADDYDDPYDTDWYDDAPFDEMYDDLYDFDADYEFGYYDDLYDYDAVYDLGYDDNLYDDVYDYDSVDPDYPLYRERVEYAGDGDYDFSRDVDRYPAWEWTYDELDRRWEWVPEADSDGAQPQAQEPRYAGQAASPTQPAWMRGTVVHSRRVWQGHGEPAHQHLLVMLDTRDGRRLAVDLGRADRLRNVHIARGEQIRIQGQMIERGGQRILLASRLQDGGRTINLDNRQQPVGTRRQTTGEGRVAQQDRQADRTAQDATVGRDSNSLQQAGAPNFSR